MEHIQPVYDNLMMCCLPYKHLTYEQVVNDECIDNNCERYSKACVVVGTNCLTNCLIFSIECSIVSYHFCLEEFKIYNQFMIDQTNGYYGMVELYPITQQPTSEEQVSEEEVSEEEVSEENISDEETHENPVTQETDYVDISGNEINDEFVSDKKND